MPEPSLVERVLWRIQHLRFLGVLQRIGILYIAAALISLRATRRQIIAITAAILLGYWILMTLVPVPGTGTIGAFVLDQASKTLAARSDRAILGPNHIWSISKTWDREGPLSTLPAIATALLGTGEISFSRCKATHAHINPLSFCRTLGHVDVRPGPTTTPIMRWRKARRATPLARQQGR